MSALDLRRASIKLVNSFLSSFERPQGIEGDGFRCKNIHQSIRLVVTLFRTSNSCLIWNDLASFYLRIRIGTFNGSAPCVFRHGLVECYANEAPKRLAEMTHFVVMWKKNITLKSPKRLLPLNFTIIFIGFIASSTLKQENSSSIDFHASNEPCKRAKANSSGLNRHWLVSNFMGFRWFFLPTNT